VTLLQRSQKPQRTKIPTSGSARGGEAGCITPCEGLRLHPDHYTRIDVYREQLLDLARRLEEADIGLSCWVGDGYYAKKKMFAAVDRIGSHLITRLRSDANLRYLYTGPPTGTQGPEKQYDGKIRWDDREQLAERFEEVGRLPGRSEIRILTTVANSPHFGRDFRVVLLLGPDDHVVLCSTDTTRPAEQIAAYYRLRTTDFVLPTSLSDRICNPRCQGVEPSEIVPVGAARRPHPRNSSALSSAQPREDRLSPERKSLLDRWAAPLAHPSDGPVPSHLPPRGV